MRWLLLGLLALLRALVAAPAPATRLFEVSIDATGGVFVAGERVDEAGLRERVRVARARDAALVARVCTDEHAAHGHVLHIIEVLRREWG